MDNFLFNAINIDLNIEGAEIQSGILETSITIDETPVPIKLVVPETNTKEDWVLNLLPDSALSLSAVLKAIGAATLLGDLLPGSLSTLLSSVTVADVQLRFANDLQKFDLIQSTFFLKVDNLKVTDLMQPLTLPANFDLGVNDLRLFLVIDDPLGKAAIKTADFSGGFMIDGRLFSINIPLSFSPWPLGDLGFNLDIDFGLDGLSFGDLSNLFGNFIGALNFGAIALPDISGWDLTNFINGFTGKLGLPDLSNIKFFGFKINLNPEFTEFKSLSFKVRLPEFSPFSGGTVPDILGFKEVILDLNIAQDESSIKLLGGEILGIARIGKTGVGNTPVLLPFKLDVPERTVDEWILTLAPENTFSLSSFTAQLGNSDLLNNLPSVLKSALTSVSVSNARLNFPYAFNNLSSVAVSVKVDSLDLLPVALSINQLSLSVAIDDPLNKAIIKTADFEGSITVGSRLIKLNLPMSLSPWPFGGQDFDLNLDFGQGFSLSSLLMMDGDMSFGALITQLDLPLPPSLPASSDFLSVVQDFGGTALSSVTNTLSLDKLQLARLKIKLAPPLTGNIPTFKGVGVKIAIPGSLTFPSV